MKLILHVNPKKNEHKIGAPEGGFSCIHWGTISDRVKKLSEQSWQSGSLALNLPREKGGRSGWPSVADSFFNIKTTEDMVGLSYASS